RQKRQIQWYSRVGTACDLVLYRRSQTRAQRYSLRVPIVLHYLPFYDLLHQQIRIRNGELVPQGMISESALLRGGLDGEDHLHGPNPRLPQEGNARIQAGTELVHRFQALFDGVVQSRSELAGSFAWQRV